MTKHIFDLSEKQAKVVGLACEFFACVKMG